MRSARPPRKMAGTFLVLVLRPAVAFVGGNPLVLTTIGDFVVKNLVLLAAGLVVGSTVRGPRPTVSTDDIQES